MEDNPLGEPGVKPRTFRLPNQEAVILRHLGPRTLEQVPPGELAEMMCHAGDQVGWEDHDRLFRTTLAAYGLKRLTPNVVNRLHTIILVGQERPAVVAQMATGAGRTLTEPYSGRVPSLASTHPQA